MVGRGLGVGRSLLLWVRIICGPVTGPRIRDHLGEGTAHTSELLGKDLVLAAILVLASVSQRSCSLDSGGLALCFWLAVNLLFGGRRLFDDDY